MNKRSLPLLGLLGAGIVLVAPAASLFACATDNGDSVHGPQFGAVPERPDGSAADGPVVTDQDGATSDGEAGSTEGGPDGTAPCTDGTVAVLAGNDSTASGAVQIHGGAWAASAISGGAAKSIPALVAFGAGFTGLTRGANDALQTVTYDGATWSAATAVGSLVTLGSPAPAVVGTKLQAVFLSGPESGSADSHKFMRIENSGAGWSAADPVVATTPSFGPSAPTAAGAGADLVIAQDGDDSKLYTQAWNAVWVPAAAISDVLSTLKTAPPALVAVTGKFDLVLLYAQAAIPNVIGFATRDATSKAWSTGQVTQPTAQTAEQMSVARISPATLLVSFRGNDARPYTMLGTIGATSITWGLPTPLLADSSTVDSAPAVAKGVCGDDAIAVFASGGVVKATQYRGTTWTVPGTIPGTGPFTGPARVSVATR